MSVEIKIVCKDMIFIRNVSTHLNYHVIVNCMISQEEGNLKNKFIKETAHSWELTFAF